MASLSAEAKIEFLLAIMSTAAEFKPDFSAAAKDLGLGSNADVSRRLKSIAEADKKFELQSTRGCKSVTTIVRVGGTAVNGSAKGRKAMKGKKRTKTTDDAQSMEEGKIAAKQAKKAKREEVELRADDIVKEEKGRDVEGDNDEQTGGSDEI